MPKRNLAPWQAVTLLQRIEHFALLGGVATGKTHIGADWAVDRMHERPDLRGFIGANTHDQLAQVSLRLFFQQLEEAGIQYVSDCMPPKEWGEPKRFKKYANMICARLPSGKVIYIFTRVLSKGDNLRGLEFGWYWIDETRDTPNYTHDVILARMRQDKEYRRGLVTSTTNGYDWVYDRFIKGSKGDGVFGSMHVPTIESVRCGIISQSYYDVLRGTYSPMMAEQELDAKHVNIFSGRAYYAQSDKNCRRKAPWGAEYPDPERTLIVGCDFNFAPAPCVWVFGQRGPDLYGPSGEFWGDCIHWFGEIAIPEASTETMTEALLLRVPGFFFDIYGDASGNRGTTSNAGDTDYVKIAQVLRDNGVNFSIDADQANPFVKKRVEAVNAMYCNALGQRRMTYDPERCPMLHGDNQKVGWKKNAKAGTGKLDDGGDVQRTHAADAVGYPVYKLFGPESDSELVAAVPSSLASSM